MPTEDGAKNLLSSEFNSNQSADPLTPREQPAGADTSDSAEQSNSLNTVAKPVENGRVEEEVVEEGARAAAEPGEVVIEAAEVTTEGDLSSESFGESQGLPDAIEPAPGVLSWAPEEDHEHKRVKVYELIGSRWVDQGTAFCLGSFQNETQEAFIIARAENNYNEIILSTAIRGNDVYQRQQDTLIVWTEPDGVDYALSFQDPDGCSEVWNFILDVQRHMNANGDDHTATGSSSPLIGPNESITTTSIIRAGHLPTPRMGIMGEIERAIKALARTQVVKEKICEYIQQEEYLKSMIEVMNVAEDQESIENLHALCSLMQTILMLNDHSMYEHILEDDIFFGVVGMLEYDPEFPLHKANYREFLHSTTRFHQPIPIRDTAIQKKIHHTYRLQFMKDVVLARALDDSTFNVLNSCIIFNQIDIINHVQQDVGFLREVVGLYVDDDMLSGGGAKKNGAEGMEVDKSPNSTENANGSVTATQTSREGLYAFAPPDELTDDEKSIRREVVFLIQQLCVMGKNVQLPARMALFRALVDRGILFAVQWALALPEKDEVCKPVISAAGEVLAALLDHDLNGVRGHVLKQIVAIDKEREAKKKGAEKADTILALMCKIMAQSRELAVQSQVGDALKVILEIPQTDAPEPNTVIGVKLLGRGKDDPGTEKFLDSFYKTCIELLLKPFSEIPEFKNLTAAFRFFRICLKLNNRNLTNYFIKCGIAGPLVQLTLQESRRDNLLSSSCQELFEHLRKENLKDFIAHCMNYHEAEIRKLAETPLGGPRFMSFIRRWEMNNEPPPKEEKTETSDLRAPNQSRLVEAEEEDYFNTDEDDDTDYIPAISASILPRGQSPTPTLNALKRKRRAGLNISSNFRPVLTPRTTPIGSLVDYDDEDDDLATMEAGVSAARQKQGPPSPNLLSSPRLANRQVPPSLPPQRPPPDDDDEDNMLESLVRSKGDRSPSPSTISKKSPSPGPELSSMRPMVKRQRDEEDGDEELLERLASKAKRPDLGAEKVLPVTGMRVGTKVGDDPPKKIKLKFGLTSLGAAPSEPGAKDGDTG
ncbi:hypothetical protein HWV62_24502 [Athelia sp. TMB]|nr:hypothetical protein HWV62_24502 [Athelia sp. TMB]